LDRGIDALLEKELGNGRDATRFGGVVLSGDAARTVPSLDARDARIESGNGRKRRTVSRYARPVHARDVRTTVSGNGRRRTVSRYARPVHARDVRTESWNGRRGTVSRYARPVHSWKCRTVSRDVDVWDGALHERVVASDHGGVHVGDALAGSGSAETSVAACLVFGRAVAAALVGSSVLVLGSSVVALDDARTAAGRLVVINNGARDVQAEVDGAAGADVVPQGQAFVAGRAGLRRRSDHAEHVPRVEEAVDRLREQRARRVQVEVARVAAVDEARRGPVLPAEVAHVRDSVTRSPPARGADELEAVRVREELDGLLEVVGARLVDADAAVLAAVTGVPGELKQADVALGGGVAVVFRLLKRMV
jgi:hypothetical protein